jgi:hypothetical protein
MVHDLEWPGAGADIDPLIHLHHSDVLVDDLSANLSYSIVMLKNFSELLAKGTLWKVLAPLVIVF